MDLRLDVPFVDAAAEDLAWALLPGTVAPAGLAAIDVPGGAASARLHVLGASHAVELTFAGGARLTEVVACGAPDGRALAAAPARLVRDGLEYRFAADVETTTAAAVATLADDLRAELAGHDGALFAAFPGAPGAATALRTLPVPGGAGWETWHLYPERHEVVRTRTTVAPLPEAAR
ncbi:DUF2617 family protein [Patulibacter sp. SYSU D01012]|uniref:DUF2617 family protein n=1 Tax=Patulibacter sp. SYSU D01012 TaxID=2817381 RepID=UPI001B313D97